MHAKSGSCNGLPRKDEPRLINCGNFFGAPGGAAQARQGPRLSPFEHDFSLITCSPNWDPSHRGDAPQRNPLWPYLPALLSGKPTPGYSTRDRSSD